MSLGWIFVIVIVIDFCVLVFDNMIEMSVEVILRIMIWMCFNVSCWNVEVKVMLLIIMRNFFYCFDGGSLKLLIMNVLICLLL